MNPLKQLEACGQSIWLDYLKRSLIESGELRTLVERDGLKGGGAATRRREASGGRSSRNRTNGHCLRRHPGKLVAR